MVQEYTRTAGLPQKAEAEYDKRRQLVEKFIDECKQHSHYQHLNARPERFSEWEENHNIRQQYFHWVMNDSNCPTLKMDIEFPHKEIIAEAKEKNVSLLIIGDPFSATTHLSLLKQAQENNIKVNIFSNI